jgi:hypothetical protein
MKDSVRLDDFIELLLWRRLKRMVFKDMNRISSNLTLKLLKSKFAYKLIIFLLKCFVFVMPFLIFNILPYQLQIQKQTQQNIRPATQIFVWSALLY